MLRKHASSKNEQILKELSKTGANKRCIDCNIAGTQYIITNFGVFVCATCSGVHRQFAHRVKGISMSSFTDKEVETCKMGGNDVFLATYCSSWNPNILPRPTDRNPDRLRTWIEDVYEKKKFMLADAPATAVITTSEEYCVPEVATPGGGDNPISEDFAVLKLSDVFGVDVPRLQVNEAKLSAFSEKQQEEDEKLASDEKPEDHSTLASVEVPPVIKKEKPAVAEEQLSTNPLIIDTATAEASTGFAMPGAWDPFAVVETRPTTSAPVKAFVDTPAPVNDMPEAPATDDWAAFGDGPESLDNHALNANGNTKGDGSNILQQLESLSGLEADATGACSLPPPSSNGSLPNRYPDTGADTLASENTNAMPTAVTTRSASSTEGNLPTAIGTTPASQQLPGPVSARKEVPLDFFYPEFERIRATGMLPTGQPVPFPHSGLIESMSSPYGRPPVISFGASHIIVPAITPNGVPAQASYFSQTIPSPRPSIALPSASFGPVFTNIPHGEMLPRGPEAFQEPHAVQKLNPVSPINKPTVDPFGALVSGFGGAPSASPANTVIPSATELSYQMPMPQATAPSDAATATLFGSNLALTAYDLSAPAAPRPSMSGNPFA